MGLDVGTTGSAAMSGATVAIVAGAYLKTAFASIPGGDSGELVAEACTLGHAHPPGYPLFTLLYHAIVHQQELPGSPAWRANATTCILGALAAGVLQACGVELIAHYGITPRLEHAILSAGLATAYALSPLVWLYSTGAEVFALNNLLVVVLLWLTLRYLGATSSRTRDFYINLGSFWSGLALCNQHTAILFEVPLIACILAQEFRRGRVGAVQLVRWSILFLLGLLPYVYLPLTLMANRQPGAWGDTTTISGFVHHLRRGDYGTFRLFTRSKDGDMGMFGRIGLYVDDLVVRQGAVLIPFLAIAGATMLVIQAFAQPASTSAAKNKLPRALAKQQRTGAKKSKNANANSQSESNMAAPSQRETSKEASGDTDDVREARERQALAGPMLVAALTFYVVVFHFLSNMPMDQALLRGIQARFWMQPNLIVFLLAIVPLASQLSTFRDAAPPSIAPMITLAVASALALALSAYQWIIYHEISDQSTNMYMERYAKALVAGIPAQSLLIVGYDQHWTALRYLQKCEGFRPDVAILNGPMLTYTWQDAYHEAYANWGKCAEIPYGSWVHSNSQMYADGQGYSTVELFDKNTRSCPGGVYFTGKLNYATDTAYNETFTLQSFGFVTRIVPRAEEKPFQEWLKDSLTAWEKATAELGSELPPLEKYSPETWEWTLRRDLFDHLYSDAQIILEHGVEVKDVDLIIFAAASFRNGYENDRDGLSDINLKNLGLAFMSLARMLPHPNAEGGIDLARNPALEPLRDQHIRTAFRNLPSNAWHDQSARLTVLYWQEYLETPAAKIDSQRETIEATVAAIRNILEKSAKSSTADPGKDQDKNPS